MYKRVISRLGTISWALFLISLPVTNFPFFPLNLVGSANVRPLLIYPLLVLLLLVTLPSIWRKRLPVHWVPFFVFVALSLVSTILPIIAGEVSQFGEVSITSRAIRGVITLLLAGGVYLTVSIYIQDERDLNFTLRWLYIGLIITMFWGSLQIISVLEIFPRWYYHMTHIQKYFTMNVGSPNRIMGLTLEPSWFADQITALWLPWVLPAVLLDRTVFQRRWGWLTVEKILLPWMCLVLLFTLSRAGFVVAAVVIASGVLFFRTRRSLPPETGATGFLGKMRKIYWTLPPLVRISLTVITAVIVLAGALFLVSLQSKYIFRMWDYWLNISLQARAAGSKSLSGYFRFIGFGPRFIYWETAFRTFLENPLFGVGLGNYTFHFLDNLPAIQVGYMPEILTRIVPDYVRIVTPKNYFARLLAETGLLGTSAFITFLVTLTAGGLYLWLSDQKSAKFWGAGALLGMIAFLVDSFSYDSLAIPNPWVVFGLITGAVYVYGSVGNQDNKVENESE